MRCLVTVLLATRRERTEPQQSAGDVTVFFWVLNDEEVAAFTEEMLLVGGAYDYAEMFLTSLSPQDESYTALETSEDTPELFKALSQHDPNIKEGVASYLHGLTLFLRQVRSDTGSCQFEALQTEIRAPGRLPFPCNTNPPAVCVIDASVNEAYAALRVFLGCQRDERVAPFLSQALHEGYWMTSVPLPSDVAAMVHTVSNPDGAVDTLVFTRMGMSFRVETA